MMDGVSVMDTGSNRPLLQMNVESIAEVKVLTSSYQAEYGRSSGLQITAVTKSGTNRFRGSVYDVERNSDWNTNSKTNKLNGDPKTISKERDWGFSIGGPVGKPGGNNKLFFFYSQEFEPRTGGNNVQRYRMPTALERAGRLLADDRQQRQPVSATSRIRGSAGACTAADQTACFADGGVLGRIPADLLYQTGLNILKHVPAADHRQRPGGPGLQLRDHAADRVASSAGSRRVRLDYQADAVAARDRSSTRAGAAQPGHQRHAARLQRHEDADAPVVQLDRVTVNYSADADDVPRGDLRAQPERAGRLRARAVEHRAVVLHRRACR